MRVPADVYDKEMYKIILFMIIIRMMLKDGGRNSEPGTRLDPAHHLNDAWWRTWWDEGTGQSETHLNKY